MVIYLWSLSDSVFRSTSHFSAFLNISGVTHMRSTTDSPRQWTQVLISSLLARCTSDSAAYSRRSLGIFLEPLTSVLRKPHLSDLALKSPININCPGLRAPRSWTPMSVSILSYYSSIGQLGGAAPPPHRINTILISPHSERAYPRPATRSLRGGE